MTNSRGSEIKAVEIWCTRGVHDEEMIKIHDFIAKLLKDDLIQTKSRTGRIL